MKETRLSVVVPVYNVEDYLEHCVSSILAQTYPYIEIILVDDGSTDRSGELCDELAGKHPNITVIHQANGGVSSARNTGMKAAKGGFIAFVDPDDWLEPEMYQRMMEQIEAAEADAVFCGYWERYENGLSDILHSPEKTGVVDSREAQYQCLIGIGYGYFVAIWNKLFRKSSLLDDRGEFVFFQSGYIIGEDELWLFQVLQHMERVVLDNTPFYHWRQRENSALHNDDGQAARWYTALKAKEKMLEALSQDEKLRYLAAGKIYCDMAFMLWVPYCNGDRDTYLLFKELLRPYRRPFYGSRENSVAKKLRFAVLELLTSCHMPRCLVIKVGGMNSYRIKEKWGLQRRRPRVPTRPLSLLKKKRNDR